MPVDPVPAPVTPEKSSFLSKVNADTIIAFVIGEASFVASVFPTDPKVALVCQLIGGSALAAAVAFHFDGK